MGSYISVGFVFKNNKSEFKIQVLKSLLEKSGMADYSIIIYKVCRDIDGEKWFEKSVKYEFMTDKDYDVITKNYYGNLLMFCPLKGINNQMVNINLYEGDTFFGYLIELFDINKRDIDYEKIEASLVDFITNCGIPFEYAFCENEGEIEFSPDELNVEDTNYSILITNNQKEGFNIVRGQYLIDGKTLRV